MLDNLRSQSSFEPDETESTEPFITDKKPKKPRKEKKERQPLPSLDKMTGMKAGQRFTLALMLFIMVCLLGTILLVLTGKVVLPMM
jgi:hypothetical protein